MFLNTLLIKGLLDNSNRTKFMVLISFSDVRKASQKDIICTDDTVYDESMRVVVYKCGTWYGNIKTMN